jgi:hypothetical protein
LQYSLCRLAQSSSYVLVKGISSSVILGTNESSKAGLVSLPCSLYSRWSTVRYLGQVPVLQLSPQVPCLIPTTALLPVAAKSR